MIDIDEERAAMRVIAFLASFAVAAAAIVAALIISGCALLDTVASDERVQAEFDEECLSPYQG